MLSRLLHGLCTDKSVSRQAARATHGNMLLLSSSCRFVTKLCAVLQGLAVKAVRGDALLFYSLKPNGEEDPTSMHGSCPTLKVSLPPEAQPNAVYSLGHSGIHRDLDLMLLSQLRNQHSHPDCALGTVCRGRSGELLLQPRAEYTCRQLLPTLL